MDSEETELIHQELHPAWVFQTYLLPSVASFGGSLVVANDLAGVQAAVTGKDKGNHTNPGKHIQIGAAEHLHTEQD